MLSCGRSGSNRLRLPCCPDVPWDDLPINVADFLVMPGTRAMSQRDLHPGTRQIRYSSRGQPADPETRVDLRSFRHSPISPHHARVHVFVVCILRPDERKANTSVARQRPVTRCFMSSILLTPVPSTVTPWMRSVSTAAFAPGSLVLDLSSRGASKAGASLVMR